MAAVGQFGPSPVGLVHAAAGQPLGVQISSPRAHPLVLGQSGAWTLSLFALGVTLVAVGMVRLMRRWHWRAGAVPVRGRIVDNALAPRSEKRPRWFPLVEFDAWRVLITSDLPPGPVRDGWTVGSAIDLLYDPTNPRRAMLADARATISGWLVAGLVLVVVAAFV